MSTPTMDTDNPTWERFRAGTLPCASCGIAVTVADPDRIEMLELQGGTFRTGDFDLNGKPRSSVAAVDVPVTRCDECEQIRLTARHLLEAHSSVRGAIGDPGIARHRVECALNALEISGVTDHRIIDGLTCTATDLRKLLDALTVPGGQARWAARAASLRQKALKEPANPTRWGHVTDGQRRAIREAYVHLHAARFEPEIPVPCPSEDGSRSGCMLCGAGFVLALRSRADYQWTAMSADSETIGGRVLPEPIDGFVCPPCDYAIDQAGAVGPTAMTLAVLAHLGVPQHSRVVSSIEGIVGWAVSGAPRNGTPWEHVDLSAIQPIKEQLDPNIGGEGQPSTPRMIYARH